MSNTIDDPINEQEQEHAVSHTHEAISPDLRYGTREEHIIDTKSEDLKTEEADDQQRTQQTRYEYHRVTDKNSKCCTLKLAFIIILLAAVALIAVAAFAMSTYVTVMLASPPEVAESQSTVAIPLTQDDWRRINETIDSLVNQRVEQHLSLALDDKFDSLSDRIAKIEQQNNTTTEEIKSLKSELAELRTTSQEYRNKTDVSITELSEESGHLENRITLLYGIANDTVMVFANFSQQFSQLPGDVQRLNEQVQGYHSNGAASLSNKTTVSWLAVIFTCLLINWL